MFSRALIPDICSLKWQWAHRTNAMTVVQDFWLIAIAVQNAEATEFPVCAKQKRKGKSGIWKLFL